MPLKTLRHLTRKERKALDEFVAQLCEHYPDELLLVRLFGSKARGNFDEESDVDVLVVVRDDTDYHDDGSALAMLHRPQTHEYYCNVWEPIVELSADLQLKYGAVLSPRIMPHWKYDFIKRQNLLLYRNMRHHGVNLWTRKESTRSRRPASKPPMKTSRPRLTT